MEPSGKQEELNKNVPGKLLAKSNSSFRPRGKVAKGKEVAVAESNNRNRHLHWFILFSKPRNEIGQRCKGCGGMISGSEPMYQCVDCDEYIFHKSCAETPSDISDLPEKCPQYLKQWEPVYHFSMTHGCTLCEADDKGFSDDCHDCLFETTLKCGFLPAILDHESHEHPLNLLMMPLSYNYEYGCRGCGDFGNSISYRCYDCNFNLHVNCVLLEQQIPSKVHVHPLILTFDSLEEKSWEKRCDVCKEKRKPEHWLYCCRKCDFAAHIGCATAKPPQYRGCGVGNFKKPVRDRYAMWVMQHQIEMKHSSII